MLVNPKPTEPTVLRAIHIAQSSYDAMLEIKEATGKSITVQVNSALDHVLGGKKHGTNESAGEDMGK